MAAKPNRGDVWLVDLGMVAKVRPCFVLSVPTDDDNDRVLTTLVPHTTSTRDSRFEVHSNVRFLKAGAFDAQNTITIPAQIMQFEFDATVTLIRRKELGLGDLPHGNGYSPTLVPAGTELLVPVRFLNFSGEWGKPSDVRMLLYPLTDDVRSNIRPDVAFDLQLGNSCVGYGAVISSLRPH